MFCNVHCSLNVRKITGCGLRMCFYHCIGVKLCLIAHIFFIDVHV